MTDDTKKCFEFLNKGTCKYGPRCRYSHSKRDSRNLPTRSQQLPDRPRIPISNDEASYRAWLRNVPLERAHIRPMGHSLAGFFQEALRLIDTDYGVMQNVIVKLSNEGGLQRIKELIEREEKFTQNVEKAQLFRREILPFFSIISKPEVLDSLVLETNVARLYNFIYGINGNRAAPLFKFVSEALEQTEQDEQFVSTMERSLVVFSKVLDFNTLAAVQTTLQDAATLLEKTFVEASKTCDRSLLVNCATYLQRILRRLDLGISIPVQDTAGAKAARKPATTFPTQIDPPGGRHDNDFSDVCDIRILPTSAEIRSARSEYLPDKNPSTWHVAGVDGLLDRSFRLLREDTVGQLRDAIQNQLEAQENGGKTRSQSSIRTNIYENAAISGLSIRKPTGFQFELRFPTPAKQRQLKIKEQADWWMRSQRLQKDALVCLITAKGSTTFCLVRESPAVIDAKKNEELKTSPRKGYSSLMLSLVEPSDDSIQHVFEYYLEGRKASSLTLVEFPKILLPSFEPTLKALQKIKKLGHLPFSDLLAPSDSTGLVEVAPPNYTRKAGFYFNLGSLSDKSDLRLVPGVQFEIDQLTQHSSLDRAQAVSLVDSLSRKFSLIQGPPGTGKSYTGVAALKVLLASKAKVPDLGPIICITYTNHALDQVLEDVLDSKLTSKVIRVGSQSKSEKLKNHNLRLIAKQTEITRQERIEIATTYGEMDNLVGDFHQAYTELQNCDSAASIRRYLREHRPPHFQQLFGEDEDGFQTASGNNPQKVFRAWLRVSSSKPTSSAGTNKTQNLHNLSQKERHRKYYGWIKLIRQNSELELKSVITRYRSAQDRQGRVREECDLRCLRQADIIGVTTSGLARKIEVLRRAKSKVLLCEEAGEVLEAHLLSAFLPDLEHVILIGDHLQLRPQVQNFQELSRESGRGSARSLDVSLFERLVRPDVENAVQLPYSTLDIQRRMHPSIAELIRRTLYPSLTDDDSVKNYPDVPGMRRRLFWLDHTEFESTVSDEAASTSHWNEFEVEMVAATVMHLIQQGSYRSGEIAVLTPYLGQLHRLRRRLEKSVAVSINDRDESEMAQIGLLDESDDKTQIVKSTVLQSLRVATIDNFQGEEAKVVVISLVRSNAQGKCGFLKTPNRINVLLSRAKHGMYIIGNSRTAVGIKMWSEIVDLLSEKGNIGAQLELRCLRHPDKDIRVTKPEDFVMLSPEGGCEERCRMRLSCGHACLKRCHSDLMHRAVHCIEPCQRPMQGCDHSCPKPCGDPCPEKCTETIIDSERKLLCGHTRSHLPCWQAQDISSVVCLINVERTVPGCSHKVIEPCFKDVDAPAYQCFASCGQILPCGHTCSRRCCDCRSQNQDGAAVYDHGPCRQPCGRQYNTCIHACKSPCHGEEPCHPCGAPCDVGCGHSSCPNRCSEPCAPCAEEKCRSACPHSQCSLPCAAPCDHVPCSRRCPEILACGHRCPSLCGEVCPDSKFCQVCAKEDVKTTVVDFIEGLQYQEVNLDETPCIFPKCGHFLTFENMDGRMGLSDHFDMQLNNEVAVPISIKTKSLPFSMKDIQTCPTCRGSLRNLARYGRQIRRALLDESTKKLIVWSNQQYSILDESFQDQLPLIKTIESREPPVPFPTSHTKPIVGNRDSQVRFLGYFMWAYDANAWKEVSAFRFKLMTYDHRVRSSEQPFNKVRNAVDNIRRRTGRTITFNFDESLLQTKGSIMAASLLLRLDIALLIAFLSLKKPVISSSDKPIPNVDLETWKTDCLALLKEASETKRSPQQVEACIYIAQICAIKRAKASEENAELFRLEGVEYLNQAKALCTENSHQTRGLREEIVGVEKMLRESTFYSQVSSEERQAVLQAMAREFRGTGHWYRCQNGHPFTIGECGMPMEMAQCPECQAPVGGQNHASVEGVRHANDLEAELQ